MGAGPASVTDPDAPAIARLLHGDSVAGGGALLAGGLVITCAHVVNRALGIALETAERPSEPVTLDFPLQGGARATASVVAWDPLVKLGEGDVAVLALDGDGPAGVPLELSTRAVAADESLRLFGFPVKRPDGVWKRDLHLAGPLLGGWQQLLSRGARDYKLQRGFSGCPILGADGKVIGLFARAEEAADVDAGASIPSARIVDAVARHSPPEVAVAATSGHILDQLHEHARSAADLLRIAAFLAPDDIPASLFAGNEELMIMLAPLSDPSTYADAVDALAGRSLVTPAADGFSVHPLVQAAIRDRLGVAGATAFPLTAAIYMLDDKFRYDPDDVDALASAGRLASHVIATCGYSRALGMSPGLTSQLLSRAGDYLYQDARFAEARAAYDSSLAIVEEELGPEAPEAATRLSGLARALSKLGDTAGAKHALERALAINEAALGPDDPGLGQDLRELGHVLAELGRLGEARDAVERALAIDEASFDPNDVRIAADLHRLGSVLHDLGDLDGARAALERTVPILVEVYGAGHVNVAIALGKLGETLQRQGDLDGAYKAYERALTIAETALGENDPDLLLELHNLGGVLIELGDREAAKVLAERALAIAEGAYGPDHRYTEVARSNVDFFD
jgi:tetratricopeptide (TPR) repeat protein